MPTEILSDKEHSEVVQDIITAVPSWIIRWGITLIFAIICGIILLAALIDYPDIIRAKLKVNSVNSPKAVLARLNGKLSQLLVEEGQRVKKDQALAYFESTADPADVILLRNKLKSAQDTLGKQSNNISDLPNSLHLGELQSSYQSFYQQYIQFLSTQDNGYYLKKIGFLEKSLEDTKLLRDQIIAQKKIQVQEYSNRESEYRAYQKLYKNKVISTSEFLDQENKFLSSKYPLQQSETNILNNTSSYNEKAKELVDLRQKIAEEQAKFIQALNQCINEIDAWMLLHVLRAPFDGWVSFAGVIQQNQNITQNEEVFIVNPGNTTFFGEIQIPQYNMGKIRIGERTLVKLHSYPFEQFGAINGEITGISDVAYRDSIFSAKVKFNSIKNPTNLSKIVLKNGMTADAEIITEESSLLQRFFRNIVKMLNSKG